MLVTFKRGTVADRNDDIANRW